MKAVILAGGRGRRLSSNGSGAPKPLVEVGGRPIIWHVLKLYARHGVTDFVIGAGHRADEVSDWFERYLAQPNGNGAGSSRWRVRVVDTGVEATKGERLLALRPYLQDRAFMLTYCDGVSDVDLTDLLRFHEAHGKIATVSAVHPTSRFGRLVLDGDRVTRFDEKQPVDDWINAGFMVFEPQIFDYLALSGGVFERGALTRLALVDELRAYRHDGFWQCMDTPKEALRLNELWARGQAPWRTWE